MSKSTVALICTWILVGLVGAFFGGYFWEKRNVDKVDNLNGGNTVTNSGKINDVNPPSITNPASNSIPNGGNKTATQPNGNNSSTPASNDTNKTIVQPNQQN